eukprot:CAMPEP_0204385736 /NCGR_PEP_ID=MMETSP0469-20131031/57915_1 /ASSEMBLY_ACC=CAM_ASM_000384 /TAXON_ID=2969 /ORGANISM="Oxyrrhis marina" /LENGTH=41 /DNA_ID= /DNA_START= /DNA_END= /DNA_ORIENTATION=
MTMPKTSDTIADNYAPPELDIDTASCTPLTKAPDSMPAVQF